MSKDDELDGLLRQASRVRAGARPPAQCIDAETLAAWTDGTLTAVERSTAEAHAADCERCLAMLAAMARTAPPPSVPQRSTWFFLRWAAPLTTAALAITAWVVIQQAPPGRPAAPQPPSTVAQASKPGELPAQAESDPAAKAPAANIEKKEARPSDASQSSRAAAPLSELSAPVAENRKVERQQSAPAPPPAAAAASPPAAAPGADAQDRAAVQSFAAQQPVSILSPDPNIVWRLSDRGIQRSIDAGRTWTVQRPGAEADLLAGASPDPDVCWIVGRMGIVLLTTDGETWRRIDFPDPAATLVHVAAVNPLDATVTTSDRRTYRTTDGGRTWTLQETPGPSF